jgi:hypothetical protein
LKIRRRASETVKREQAKERLALKCAVVASGCWIWTGDKTIAGYGKSSFKGDFWLVHRLSLFLYKPEEYSDSLNVCHKCNVPSCFNPEHLFAGTQSKNMLDAVEQKTQYQAAKTHCPSGHEYTPENTKLNPKTNGRLCRICIDIHSLTRSL